MPEVPNNPCDSTGMLNVAKARRQQVKDSTVAVCSTDRKHEAETRISQRETRVHSTRVSVLKREVSPRFVAERETRVQHLAKPKHKVHVSLPKREIRVEEQGLLKHDLRISTHKCEVRV